MSIWVILIMAVAVWFIFLSAFFMIKARNPWTKEEEVLKFQQDCEDFDKYMSDKNKKQ